MIQHDSDHYTAQQCLQGNRPIRAASNRDSDHLQQRGNRDSDHLQQRVTKNSDSDRPDQRSITTAADQKRPPIRPKPEQLPNTVTFEDSDRPEQRPITTAADQNVD